MTHKAEGYKPMEAEKDPREAGKEIPKTPHPAPGGAGTGTKNDPAKEPAAQPNPGPRK